MLECADYREANAVSRRINGKGFTRQGFALVPKIIEVDEVVRRQPGLTLISEGHPEVSFALMNGREPLADPKRTPDGRRHRLGLLRRHLTTDAESLVDGVERRFQGDAVDALALLWTARRLAQGQAESFPETPEIDEHGLEAAIRA